MKVVLVTYHAANARRKTGFHFWAELLAGRGHKVDWVTVGLSRLTFLKKDNRTYEPPFNRWISISENFRKFVWCPPFHPANFNNTVMNYLSWPLFALYPHIMPKKLEDEIKDADLFIVESGAGVTLIPRLSRIAPKARFLYNFSDRYSVIQYHPMIPHADFNKAMPHYDMIRVNAAVVANDFPQGAPVVYVPQAIDKALFDRAAENPYQQPRNAITIGDMQFDARAVEIMAENFPDWTFHIFGRRARITKDMPNVKTYGEFDMLKLVPYIKHADIGLAPYLNSDQQDYLSQSSLKLVQYTYCRLPIVAPHFAAHERVHVCSYDAANLDTTIPDAFRAAIGYDRNSIRTDAVLNWDQMLDRMLEVMKV